MPTLSFSSPGPLVANIQLTGPTVSDVHVVDLGDGLVSVEIGDNELGARIIGPLPIIHALIVDADNLLARLRGGR